jgi:predicted dehydrogenase
MADKLRCGVIGTGAIGIGHLLSLTSTPRAAAVAIAEPHAQRAKETSERFKIPRSYNDYRELLDQPDIDAVTIATPNHLHAEMTIEALKARKHVLLEKPLATNSKDAARIIDAAKKSKRTLMVGQNFRFNRYTQMAKMIIDRHELGDVYHARCFWLRRNGIPRIGSWFTQKKFAGGGCAYDIGGHLLDACLHLMNDFDVVSVCAQTYAKFGPRGQGEMDWGKGDVDPQKPFDVDDFAVAFFRLKSGRTVILESSWAAYVPSDTREYGIDLFGENAGISLYPARMFRNGPNGYETVHLNVPKLPHSEDRIHHFVASILDGKKPLVPLDESLQLQHILDAIYASAASGKEVRLK